MLPRRFKALPLACTILTIFVLLLYISHERRIHQISTYLPSPVPPRSLNNHKTSSVTLSHENVHTRGALTQPVLMLRGARGGPGMWTSAAHRSADLVDSFENFTRSETCALSSLALHEPFEPLCEDKANILAALSGGGRAGMDMPYIPFGCDMRWLHTREICTILSRFSYIIVVGDSLMRHVASALNFLIRQDLVYGGYTKWHPNEDIDCSCEGTFNKGDCFLNEAWSGSAIYEHDPESMACPSGSAALIEYNKQTKLPMDNEAKLKLANLLPEQKPEKPLVIVAGHGLWFDLERNKTKDFMHEFEAFLQVTRPWLSGVEWPKLFMSPSAAGEMKPIQYAAQQSNSVVMKFEHDMTRVAEELGYDFLGTFNMTVQGISPDGAHSGRNSDLIKAMSVYNWLAML